MPTTTLRKVLDQKVWQSSNPAPVTNAANMCVAESAGADQLVYYVTSATAVYAYDPSEDAWSLLPSPALATFGVGATARWHAFGPTGTASAGAATTITTATNVQVDLSPKSGIYHRIRITSGTGAGQERLISSAIIGANSVITVSSAWTTNPDATSVYQLLTGRVYISGGGVTVAGSFKYWDHATQTWSGNLVITGLPTFTAESVMTDTSAFRTLSATPQTTASYAGGFATGTATSGSATTIVNTAKNWTVNQWANYQVRIIAGTGAGKVATITSNTATTLTFPTVTTVLDATSVYVIEGDDDKIYVLGNAAVTLYRYSISLTTWTTVAPGTARGAVTGAGVSASWIFGVAQSDWQATASTEATVKNGDRIYSFRGGGNVLDYYSISQNTWVNAVTVSRANEVVGAGSGFDYDGANYIYFLLPPTASAPSRFLRLDLRAPVIEGWSTNVFPSPTAATAGDKIWTSVYGDTTGVPLRFLYSLAHGGTQLHRCMIW